MTTNQVIPYCIYHYINPDTNSYYGYIGYPITIKSSNGNLRFECSRNEREYKLYNPWRLYGKFYAFSPMIRPIPSGLKLFNAEKASQFPYNTKKITYVYDPFTIDYNSISFLAWNNIVADTIPLYLHIDPTGNSFPSFESTPPSTNITGWKQAENSPIYVFPYDNDKYPKDNNGLPQFKFSISQNRCVPDINGMTLEKCFLAADENIYNNTDIKLNLLDDIKYSDKKTANKSVNIFLLVSLLAVIFILFFILYKIKYNHSYI